MCQAKSNRSTADPLGALRVARMGERRRTVRTEGESADVRTCGRLIRRRAWLTDVRRLGDVARECATTLEKLLKDPLTQRILWAHARDCAPVYWTTFRYLLDPRLDRRDEARVKVRPEACRMGRSYNNCL